MTKLQNNMPFFDDCEICKAMKQALSQGKDLSYEELHEVFKKQNARQDKN